MPQKNVLVISGPTGSGESTITNELLKRFPVFQRLITATTRPPRLQEKNGTDYYFFSEEDFKDKIESREIIEHTYIPNRNTYYGSYKPDLDRKIGNGKIVIVNPDYVGTKFFKKHYGALAIFILPESIENIRTRLIARDPKISPEELDRRLANARNEIKNDRQFYDFEVINYENRLDEAINEITKILRDHDYKID